MKTNIKIPTNSIKTRILSAFMAFLILVLSAQQAFVNMGIGLIVHAEDDTTTPITMTTLQTGISALDKTNSTSNSKFYYTGTIKAVPVNMYDYLSDEEVEGSWNTDITKSKVSGYNDPYRYFNRTVSASKIVSSNQTYAASTNFTINYKPDPEKFGTDFDSSSVMYVHVWKDGSHGTTMPGQKMEWDEVNEQFTCTIHPGYNNTLDASNMPVGLLFNNGSGVQTADISQSMTANHTYTVVQTRGTPTQQTVNKTLIDLVDQDGWTKQHANSGYVTLWDTNNVKQIDNVYMNYSIYQESNGGDKHYVYDASGLSFTPGKIKFSFNSNPVTWTSEFSFDSSNTWESGKKHSFYYKDGVLYFAKSNSGETYQATVSPLTTVVTPSDGSQDLTYSITSNAAYNDPLYFGCFLQGDDADNPDNYKTNQKPGDDQKGSAMLYSNFYWQTNMAPRQETHASVQGLVDDHLTNGKLTQNSKELPYFSSEWAENNKVSGATNNNGKSVMKCWESSGDNSIAFPFYEVLTNAQGSSSGAVGYDGGETPDANASKAKFYQFDSKDANLVFHANNANPSKSYFTESTTAIKGHNNSNYTGFYPFNTSNDSTGSDINLGFGAKFEIDFRLNEDGKSFTVKQDGKLSETNTATVNTRFEFSGDDDLWVFIDGQLILDLGGAHGKTTGYIDFAQKTAVAETALTLGDDSNGNGRGKDCLGKNDKTYWTPSSGYTKTVNTSTFISKLNAGQTGTYNTATQKYDATKSHKMTVFYMECGMIESNLMIRYNFAIEPNFTKMKIKEETDFSDINPGLINATMKAAENDVFVYTVKNQGTKKGSVTDNSSLYPNKDKDFTRSNQGITTVLTKSDDSVTPTSHKFQPEDKTTNYLVGGIEYNWVDDYASMKSESNVSGITTGTANANNGGQLCLMYGTNTAKSSAEFSGQFTRYSVMQIKQIENNDYLYKPVRNESNAVTFTANTGRKIGDYYSSNNPYVYSRLNTTSTGYVNLSGNNATFAFRNNIKDATNNNINNNNADGNTPDSDLTKSVQMTEVFVNTPKTGAITIKKVLPTTETVSPANKEFTIKVRFEDVFGVSGVHTDVASEYEQIKYSVYDDDGPVAGKSNITMGSSTMKVSGQTKTCGTISLEVGQWAAIEKIPYNTKYIVDENEAYYAPDVTGDNTNVLEGTINGSNQAVSGNNATVKNFSHTLTIKEVTDFSGVNEGLLSYTKTAAEKDVFKYTVSNQNTSSSQVVDSGVLYPTYATNVRNNTDDTGSSTTTLTSANMIPDTTHVYFDVSNGNYYNSTYNITDPVWNISGRRIVAWIWGSTTSKPDKAVELERVDTNLYRFDAEDYNNVIFSLLEPGNMQTFPKYTYPANIIKYERTLPDNSTINQISEYKVNNFTKGITYKVRWSQGGGKWTSDIDNTIRYIQPSSYNYDPSSVSGTDAKLVKNTSYVWKDAYTTNDMTNITDDSGNLYLMHGTKLDATVNTIERESSAKFYNQFARGSQMTVVQDGTLTSPNGGTPDTLKANNQRGAGTSLATYYSTTKTLEGSTTSSSLTNNVLPTGTNNFAFDNNDTSHSIHITETFKNTVKTGTLKITKAINPTEGTNTTQTNAEFTFKITLTNVFGVTNNNDVGRTDYANIAVTKTGTGASGSYSMAPSSNTTENSGTFTLKAGQTLTIPDIPVGTHYEIEELSDANSYYEFKSNKYTTDNGTNWSPDSNTNTVSGNIVADETREFEYANKRKTATLTLSKSLYAYTGAAGNSDTVYNFKVALEPPTGVTLNSTNYPLTCTNSDTTTVSYNYTTHTVTVTAKANTSATISGIPYGTGFTVTEVSPTGSPVVEYNGSILENLTGNITGDTTATITNTYRKITMTKVDAEDHSLGVVGATYYLLRLKTGVDATTTDAKNEFEGTNATHTTFASSSYFEVCSGLLTTGSGGTVEVNDANVTNGLKPGKYIFFEEDAPDNYERNNSYTSDKIIEIPDNKTTLTYTKNNHEYTDTRKKGTLTLSKSVVAGTGTTLPEGADGQGFTYSITLTHNSNVKLNQYGITCTDQSNQDITGNYTEATNTYTFTATVHRGDNDLVTFTNLPYGTRYSVSETSSLPACIEITGSGTNSSPVTGGIGEMNSTTNTGPSQNASITNTYKTGSLTISKALAGDNSNYNYDTNKEFTFTVTLTPETSTFVDLSKYTFTDSSSKITNTSSDHKTITLKLKHGEITTIGNIPQGTKFTVAETNPNDSSSVKYQINSNSEVSGQYSTPSGDSNTNVITSTAKTVAFTNTYPNTVSLTLGKRTTGTSTTPSQNPDGGTVFIFKVELTAPSSPAVDLREYLNTTAISSMAYSGSSQTYNETSGVYTCYIAVKSGDDPKKIISNIPYGTHYKVTEVYNTSDGSMSSTGLKPDVSYSKAEGNINIHTQKLLPTPERQEL